MIIQTVKIFASNPPPVPYVVRAADGGFHYDCGNSHGWSGPFPGPCDCGHCLPTYEAVRWEVFTIYRESGGSLPEFQDRGSTGGTLIPPVEPPVLNKGGGKDVGGKR